MAKRPPKLPRFRHTRKGAAGVTRHYKRMARRLRRRLEALDLEEAPTRTRDLVRGWAD